MQSQTSSLLVTLTSVEKKREMSIESPTRGWNLSFQYTKDAGFPNAGASVCAIPEVRRFEQIDTLITTFAPEPYVVKHPMRVTVIQQDSEFIASHFESNVHASGDNELEALDNLKSLILDTFDSLTSEPKENLAPKPVCQLAVLQELIERA